MDGGVWHTDTVGTDLGGDTLIYGRHLYEKISVAAQWKDQAVGKVLEGTKTSAPCCLLFAGGK